jgi:hypothetical protein
LPMYMFRDESLETPPFSEETSDFDFKLGVGLNAAFNH